MKSMEGGASRGRGWRSSLVAVGVALLAVGPAGARERIAGTERFCADPADCTLAEAAALAGVRFGFHDEGGRGDADDRVAAREGNAATNHGVSWRSLQPAPGVVTGSMDAGCDFAEIHGQFQVGYHFAWNQILLDDLADWVLAVEEPDALRAVLRERVRVIFERCPSLDRIDVLNEPLLPLNGTLLNANHFSAVLGPDYIAELFRIAREEAPEEASLFLNENFLAYFPDRSAAFVALVRGLVADGAPVDAVGLQSHMLLGEPDWGLYRETMEALASLGVKVFVSELDVPAPPTEPDRFQAQAERYRRVVETCLAVPACDTILVWGISDAHTWLDSFDLLTGPDPAPLLFDEALQPKPAYFAVRDALLRGRGGDHPIAGDRLLVRRRRSSGSLLVATSSDPRVVTPSPRSGNDPRVGEPGGATLELRLADGRVERVDLAPDGRWLVADGRTAFAGARRGGSGARVVLRMVEGKSLRLVWWAEDVQPEDLAAGASLVVSMGSLRTCLDFRGSDVVGSADGWLRAEDAARRPGFDCSTTPP